MQSLSCFDQTKMQFCRVLISFMFLNCLGKRIWRKRDGRGGLRKVRFRPGALRFVNSFVQIQLRCKLCPFIYKNASYFELNQCVFVVQDLETDSGVWAQTGK
eukprot:sb/3478343/